MPPKNHPDPCPVCGGKLWLKDYDPSNLWYGCENYKKNGCKGSRPVDDAVGGGNRQRRPQGAAQAERKETFRTSKIVCPCCNVEIIVDVHASSLGVVKKDAAKPPATRQQDSYSEELGGNEPHPEHKPKPNRGGYERY